MPIYKNKPTRSRAKIDKQRINQTRITIGEDDIGADKEIEYICNYCNRTLTVKISDDEWFCNNCQISYITSIEDVRKVEDITVPAGPNTETLIACPPSPGFEDVRIRYEPEPRGVLAKFKEKGMKITSYSETDGAGRPITNRSRYDDDDE